VFEVLALDGFTLCRYALSVLFNSPSNPETQAFRVELIKVTFGSDDIDVANLEILDLS